MSRIASQDGAFFFTAATLAGGRRMGVRQAPSERALAEVLGREKLVLLRARRLPAWLGAERAGTMPLKDQAALNEQLGQLLSRGVPLVEALDVAGSVVGPNARKVVERIREKVAQGAGFASACEATGSFDAIGVALYRAGERTGNLAGAASALAQNARRQLAVRSKAATLLVYPAIVSSVGLIAGVFMLTVVVPQIGNALRSAGAKLPWYTELVVGAGELLKSQWAWAIVIVLALIALGILLRRAILSGLARALRSLPLARDLVVAQESARFFSTMAAMTRSGVPLGDALGVSVGAVHLPRLRTQLETLRSRLIEGGVVRDLVEKVDAFPLATRKLLIAADRAGDLELAFDGLAEDMQERVDRLSARLLAALEPAMIVTLFVLIGGMILAIFIPMMSLTNSALG
ncbi:MAG: type II secretion system F family protein [Phycisphaerales bacterium]|jgi:type II secretory pathway component PulF|nr:type II secretion system F family protein [Phycisphaerales bacterium]